MLLLLLACNSGPSVNAGADVYADTCAACHGEDGTAGVEVNGVPAADLTRWVPPLTDAQLEDTILEGTGEMLPLALDEEQLADVIAYLRDTFPE